MVAPEPIRRSTFAMERVPAPPVTVPAERSTSTDEAEMSWNDDRIRACAAVDRIGVGRADRNGIIAGEDSVDGGAARERPH